MGRGFWCCATGLVAGIAALAMSTVAEARDGCGRGYYFDGYDCRPERYYRPPPPRYYDEPPPGYYGLGPGLQFNFGGGDDDRRYARPIRGPNGRPTCAQRGYTIQDGLCKPYRGY